MKHIFYERDPVTGRTTAIPGLAQKVVDSNARMRNDPNYRRRGVKNEFQHVGRIPSEVWLRWMNEGFNVFTAHPSEIIKRLRDPDYAKLRVVDGKI